MLPPVFPVCEWRGSWRSRRSPPTPRGAGRTSRGCGNCGTRWHGKSPARRSGSCRWGCPTISYRRSAKGRRWSASGRRSSEAVRGGADIMALGFLGAGNMGEAMIRGLLSAKLRSPEQVVVYDAAPGRGEDLRRRFGVVSARSVEELLRACDTVVVAVKPQVLL